MWIEDLTKALWELNAVQLIDLVDHIADGIIYMTSGTKYSVAELVAQYDKTYPG
jgi:hypothetical protein